MSEDDPFADLGDTLSDDASGDAEDTPSTADDAEDAEAADPLTDPAFTYDDAKQRPFYAREETIADFDGWLKYELERELSERGYRNVVVRELTDALLRTVVEEDLIDAVGERFVAAREERESSE